LSWHVPNAVMLAADRFTQVLYRVSGGWLGERQLSYSMLLLHTVGRKTGKKRTHTLLYIRDGENLVVCASNNGSTKLPAWYLNLRATPRVRIQHGRISREVIAETVGPEERERLWQRLLKGLQDVEIAPDLLGRQETSALLDNVKQHYPVVVDELVPNLLTVGEIQRVLQNLLRERIPIRNLLLILENLADGARASKDIDYLTEKVRAAMARHICAEYAENGLLSVITVDPRLETLLGEAVRRGEDAYALLDPATVGKIYASLTKQIQTAQASGLQPVVLTAPSTRLALKRLTERAAPTLVVLSYSEIAPGLRVESIGQVSTTDESLEPAGAPAFRSAHKGAPSRRYLYALLLRLTRRTGSVWQAEQSACGRTQGRHNLRCRAWGRQFRLAS